MSRTKSAPAVTDPALALVALATALLVFGFAFAPPTREAALAGLEGLSILGGLRESSAGILEGRIGASIFAGASLIFGSERPADTLAAAFALWHWMTALFVFLVARKTSRLGAVLASIVYVAAIAADGTRTVFSPMGLVGLPLLFAFEFAASEGRRARVGFGIFFGAALLFSWEAIAILAAYAFDQHRRNRERPSRDRNRFGAYEVAGILVALGAAAIVTGLGGRPIDFLARLIPARSTFAFGLAFGLPTFAASSARFLAAAAGWVALGTRDATEASGRRLACGSVIALWLISWTNAPNANDAHLPLVVVGALAVAGVFEAASRLPVFARFGACSWAALALGILAASPLPHAIRAIGFVGPYLGGEDEVAFHGRFFDHATGFDAALTVDAAHWIAGNTQEHDAIAVWGSEPSLFLYTGGPALCGFTTIVPILAGRDGARERFAKCLRDDPPKVIAVVRDPRHWTGGFAGARAFGVVWPEALRVAIRANYRRAQRVGGFDLYLRNDLTANHVPLATIYELNVPRER